MKIAVVGTGYVGLVAGVCFADVGHHVACVDTDPRKIELLEAGEVPIYEPGLKPILERAIREGRITFSQDHADAVKGAQAVFIAVGTPEGEGGQPDLSYVGSAVRDVVAAAEGPIVLVLKSTVPVGTAAWVREQIAPVKKHPVTVVNNPEFLKEGAAVDDFLRPDRVVIGTDDDDAWEIMKELYEPFVRSGKPILLMSNEAAEMTKYAANAMLATRISFMNELSRLCDVVGVDIEQVRKGIATDSRIGRPFLYAGCGYGGSCFPKDTQGLIHVGRKHGVPMDIVTSVEKINDEQKELLAQRVIDYFGGDLTGRRIALWGLAFKPQTDDVREAPALVLAEKLTQAGATVVGTDPEAHDTFAAACPVEIEYVASPYEAAKDADAIVLCTEWNEYRQPDFGELKALVKHAIMFDGRNVYDPERLAGLGWEHHGMGRRNGLRRVGSAT